MNIIERIKALFKPDTPPPKYVERPQPRTKEQEELFDALDEFYENNPDYDNSLGIPFWKVPEKTYIRQPWPDLREEDPTTCKHCGR